MKLRSQTSSDSAPGSSDRILRSVRIRRMDVKRKQVFGEVYVPNVLDTWGEYMDEIGVEKIAHRFMQIAALKASIDTNHDEKSNGSYPIESFIARDGDPDFTPGAWVLGVQIVDDEIWERVQRGELNGFSFQAMVTKTPKLVEVDVPVETIGKTEQNSDHDHYFFVALDAEGRVIGGRTSTTNGHSHEIRQASATEVTNGHSHRFVF